MLIESRLLITSKSNPGLCNKNDCIKRLVELSPEQEDKTVEFLENLDQGIPTGRKDIQNLVK